MFDDFLARVGVVVGRDILRRRRLSKPCLISTSSSQDIVEIATTVYVILLLRIGQGYCGFRGRPDRTQGRLICSGKQLLAILDTQATGTFCGCQSFCCGRRNIGLPELFFSPVILAFRDQGRTSEKMPNQKFQQLKHLLNTSFDTANPRHREG